MTREPNEIGAASVPANDPKSLDAEWAQLRTLLLSPEQSRLEELRERLDNPVIHARDVSRVLPDAVALRGKQDPRLTVELAPYVEQGFTAAVRKSPGAIVDAIAPIMGPAIRQAILRTLNGMVESLNHTLEQSMSLRGLNWRLQAWRTGRPFAEIVLLHTLRYRVEQIFLIHRTTGLLLHHVAAEHAAVQDQQLVSGMLSAIQHFVRDSFGGSAEDRLHQMQVGDCSVWIEEGSHAVLAGVIRGTAPAALRETFQRALEQIHLQEADALSTFDGDPAPFEHTRPHLARCLESQYEAPAHSNLSAVWIVAAALGVGAAWWAWSAYQQHQRWTEIVRRLQTEPGVVLTMAESSLTGYRLAGLRDPLARDPVEVITESGLGVNDISTAWAPYYALDPSFVTRRAAMALQPPEDVTLRVEGDVLTASGTAPADWAADAKRTARLIPGIATYRDADLKVVSIPDLVHRIEQSTFHFPSGLATLESTEEPALQALKTALRDLDLLAGRNGQLVVVEIIGSADDSGPETMNLLLSDARAHAILNALGGKRLGTNTSLKTGIDSPTHRHRPARGSAELRAAWLRVSLPAKAEPMAADR